ncbi:MAG: diguanylate cyclase [Anaerolineales bacterium]|nr:diguanylate cyclase [Anaerolineales bacterium]
MNSKRIDQLTVDGEKMIPQYFLDISPDAMLILDSEGWILRVSEKAEKLFGYSREELIDQSVDILIPEELRKHHQSHRRKYMADPNSRHMGSGVDFTGLRKDGSRFFADISLNPMTMESVTMVIASIRDITRRVEVQSLLGKKVAQLEAITEIGLAISSTRDIDGLLRLIVEQAVEFVGAESCAVLLPDNDTGELVFRAAIDDIVGMRIPAGEGVVSRVLQSGKPEVVNDVSNAENHYPKIAEQSNLPTRSLLVVPLLIDGKSIGTLTAVNKIDGDFTEADYELLVTLASYAATSLHNTQLYDQVQQYARELGAEVAKRTEALRESQNALKQRNLELNRLYRASETLFSASAPILKEVAETIVKTILVEFGKSNCSLLVAGPGKNEIKRVAVFGPYADEVSKGILKLDGHGLVPRTFRFGEVVNIPDVRKEPDYAPNWKAGRSELAIPLKIGGQVIGVIDVQSKEINAFDHNDERLMGIFAERAALVLENVRLFEEIQCLATTDELTGIHNRRQLFDLGRIEIERACRYGHPLSAIMLDIDFFKKVNDTYGHGVGDQVLRALAQECLDSIREIDILGRYGGEEFAFVLPETGQSEAYVTAERLQKRIEDKSFKTTHGELTLTISLGVAETTEETSDLATLLDHADSALYAAKQAGRNCVKVSE